MKFVNEFVARVFDDFKSRGLDDEGAMRLAMRWNAMMCGEIAVEEYEATAGEELARERARMAGE